VNIPTGTAEIRVTGNGQDGPRAITTVEVTFGDSILTIIRQPEAKGSFDDADPYSAVMVVTLSDGETISREANAR
jgi:hypothetical protein